MQEAQEYIKEENFQMRGSAKNQGKDIRTKIVGRERESVCVYPCVKKKNCPRADLRRTINATCF